MLYRLGIPVLDNIMKQTFKMPSLLVIAGHPGSGKTTFATKICYSNAVEKRRCAYLTLQEDKEKLFTTMKRLGMDLESVEKEGYYHFVRLPIMGSTMPMVLDTMNRIMEKLSPRVVIIDSINALLANMEDETKKARAVLQNYFYNLPKVINGLVVLVSEIPFHRQDILLGHLEFVADTIIILKHKIDKGRLVRTMEIRKARGAPIIEAEMPFTIVEEKGIQVFASPILERIGEKGEQLKLPCKELERAMGFLKLGDHVYSYFPADERPLEGLMLAFSVAVYNNKRIQVVSYRYGSESLAVLLWRGTEYASSIYEKIKGVKIDRVALFDEFNKFIKKKTALVGINPFAYSLQELFIKEIEIVEEAKADIVMFHGSDLLEAVQKPEDYIPLIYNQVHLLKARGKLVIRANADYNQLYKEVGSSIADVIIGWQDQTCPDDSHKHCRMGIVWGRGKTKVLLKDLDIWKCIALGLEPIFKKALIKG